MNNWHIFKSYAYKIIALSLMPRWVQHEASSSKITVIMEHVIIWPLMGLLDWYPLNLPNHCNSFGDLYMEISFAGSRSFNSLWPSEATWRQISGSTLAQVMACCLMAPSHYLSQCWLIISNILHRAFYKIPLPPIVKISLKFTYLRFYSNIPGVNELNESQYFDRDVSVPV